jgi:hypothetical protein
MPQETRTYVPTRSYDLQLKIKDKDYTNDLYQLRLVSSVNSPYQIIKMSLFVDPNDAILERLYGKDPLKLIIRLIGQTKYVKEDVNFDLMFVKGSMQLGSKKSLSVGSNQKERSTFNIIAICRLPFKTMTYPVNEIYSNTTVTEVLQDLVSKTGATLEIDSQGINEEKIDQLIIPQTTLKKSIDYLDKRFGIFLGPSIYYCNFDNKVHIKNIASKVKMNQTFTIYQLSTDLKSDEIIKKCTDGKNFYTYSSIDTSYSGNVKLSVHANTERFIMTPRDQLFHVLAKNTKEVASQYGIIYQNNIKQEKFDSDDILENREKTNEDPCAYETSEVFAISNISKNLSNLSTISISLERNLPVLNLLNIGEAVKLNSQIVEFTELSGKYVLKNTSIEFAKEREWRNTCKVDLIRTNQTL